ncbi:hypothetical protein CYMTET_31195, partial [Cymbomonas tetramitiformis]
VIGSFSNFNIRWPRSLDLVFRFLNLTDLSQLISWDLIAVQCFLDTNFNLRYITTAISTLALLAIFSMPYKLGSMFIKSTNDLNVFRMTSLKALIFVMFFCYPYLGAAFLKIFPCRTLYEVEYLLHDFSQECLSTEHTLMLVLGVVMGLGFVGGVPFFFYTCMLRFDLPSVIQEKRLDQRMANLLVYFASQPLIDAPARELARKTISKLLIARMHEHFCGTSPLPCSERGRAIEDFGDAPPSESDEPFAAEDSIAEEAPDDGEAQLSIFWTARPEELNLCGGLNKEEWPGALPATSDLDVEDKMEALLAHAERPEMRVCQYQLEWQVYAGIADDKLLPSQKLERDAIIHIGFLFTGNKPGYWFFEILETLRKLIFVIIPVCFGDAHSQLIASLGMCALYVMVLQGLQPNANQLNRVVKLGFAYMLLLNSFYAWMILAGLVGEETENATSTLFAIMNVLAFLLPAAVALILASQAMLNIYCESQESQAEHKEKP